MLMTLIRVVHLFFFNESKCYTDDTLHDLLIEINWQYGEEFRSRE